MPGGVTPEYLLTLTTDGTIEAGFQEIFDTVSVPNINTCVVFGAGVAGVAGNTGGAIVGRNS
jgi:hypothetical protein